MKGQLEIGRMFGGRADETGCCVRIRLIDSASHAAFIDIEMTLHEFGTALTNSPAECEFKLRALDRVGMTAENKTAIVRYKNKSKGREHDPASLAELEIDGWKVRDGDLRNHHCWRENGIECVFFRHIGTSVLNLASEQESAKE